MSTRYRSFKYPLAPDGGPASAQNALALEQHLERDPWHDITLLNGWVLYNTNGFGTVARFRKTLSGVVFVEGTIKSGTTAGGTILFNLPEGYRPKGHIIVPIVGYGAFAWLQVLSDGNVTAQTGVSASWTSINFSFAT